MGVFNLVVGRVFDVLFWPFSGFSPWFAMVFISLLTSFLMLWVFRLTSDQEGIKTAKNAIKAHLLEMRLYKDNMRVSFRSQGRILKANLKYITCNAKPLAVMIVPLLVILAQLNLWFGAAPLKPGEATLVKLELVRTADPMTIDAAVEASGGVAVETPPVRIADLSEIAWRIKALEPGPAGLIFRVAGKTLTKSVVITGRPLAKVSSLGVAGSAVKEFLYPGEKPLPGGTPVRAIEVLYTSRNLNFLGIGVNWLVAYFILSVIFGFAFKGVFKVEI